MSQLSQHIQEKAAKKPFFTVSAVKHWNRLPREAVNDPSLSMSKRPLDNALNNML